jgi:GT2 family glycosyltransferase
VTDANPQGAPSQDFDAASEPEMRKVLVVVPSLSGSVSHLGDMHNVVEASGGTFQVVANGRSLYTQLNSSDIPVITSKSNDGFAASVLLAARREEWSWIFILNDDIHFDRTAFGEAISTAVHSGYDDSEIIHFDTERARPVPGRRAVLLNLSLLGNVLRRGGWSGPKGSGVKYRSFSAVAISRRAWDAVGGLDDGYRFTFEDADFVRRAANHGFRDVASSHPFATHLHSQTTGRWLSVVLPVTVVSASHYVDTWYGRRPLYMVGMILALIVRMPIALITGQSRRSHLVGILRAIRALVRNEDPRLPNWEDV